MRKRRAFTLVELLVVIGIIAVLMGVLLPTLGRARRQGYITACLSNQRQLVLALMMYCQDNKHTFPGGPGYVNVSGVPTNVNGIADWDTSPRNPYSCNRDEFYGPVWLAKYVKNSKRVSACPEDQDYREEGATFSDFRTSFVYPMSLVYKPMEIYNPTAIGTGTVKQTPQKITQIRYPAHKVVIIDRKTYHNNKYLVDYDKAPDPNNPGGQINSTNTKAVYINAGCADGHVERRSTFEMWDSDVNWTGRLTRPTARGYEAGVWGRDFK
jgi:prepilin-type N-terminal cleavage/methylation domain-containing protein